MEIETREILREERTGERMSDLANQINRLSLHSNAKTYVAVKLNQTEARQNITEGV